MTTLEHLGADDLRSVVGAFRDVPFTDWKSPAMLEVIAATATRITMNAGEQKSVNLAVSRIR